jgi:hypothetical protein
VNDFVLQVDCRAETTGYLRSPAECRLLEVLADAAGDR